MDSEISPKKYPLCEFCVSVESISSHMHASSCKTQKHLGKLNNICIAYLHMCHASRYTLINQKNEGLLKKKIYTYTHLNSQGDVLGFFNNSTITYTRRVHFFIGIPISKKTLEKSPLCDQLKVVRSAFTLPKSLGLC